MVDELLVALGLVMILEGIPLFLAPARMRAMMLMLAANVPDALLRRSGFLFMAMGLGVIYWVKG